MQSRNSNSSPVFTLVLASLLFTVGIGITSCADDREGTTATTGSPSAKMSDSDLEKAIEAKLDSDAQLKAADLSVDADVAQNSVTLSGTVESQALRTKAIDLAKSAHNGLVVTDKLEVKPRELTRAEWTEDRAQEARTKAKEYGDTIGDSLDDTWIHTKVVAQLIGNAQTPQRKINVDVNKNVVTLRGTVDTAQEKAEAERVAKATEGVTRVVNQLKVGAATASPNATPKKS